MESLKKFKQFELKNYNVFGSGRFHATYHSPALGDTWFDKDNSGTLNPGDSISYHPHFQPNEF